MDDFELVVEPLTVTYNSVSPLTPITTHNTGPNYMFLLNSVVKGHL